jgi:hypothetical protein
MPAAAAKKPTLELAEDDEPVITVGGASPAPAPAAAAPTAASTAVAAAAASVAPKLEGMGLTPDQVTAILSLTKEVVERVVWEVVPDLAETIIREEIQRLTK